ncbi:MAG: epr 2 [Clostridia bacterium]|jgi:hypothetical protein|nr:epr 2 [Clostridia bacterium]
MKRNRKEFLVMVILLISLYAVALYVAYLSFHNGPSKVVKIGVIDSLLDDEYISKYDVKVNKIMVKDPLLTNHGNTILSIIKQKNNAEIYYVSTLDSNLVSSIDNIAKSIYWCVENDVDIINMSFGTKEDKPKLKEAVQYALDNGVIVVASCINNYEGYSYPANYKGVVSVSDNASSKAVIVVKDKKYDIKLLDGSTIKASGTSCATAYVTGQISNELSGKSKKFITKSMKID